MCFSASASFTAGAVLSVIGITSIKKAKNSSDTAFASIPLIFAIQQISEGFVWLSLTNPDYAFMEEFSSLTFIFFAQVVWPFWVPYSICKMENKESRKQMCKVLVGTGVIAAAGLGYYLMVTPPNAEILGAHIAYPRELPEGFITIAGILLYVVATIGPPIVSSVKYMWVIGGALLISYIAAQISILNKLFLYGVSLLQSSVSLCCGWFQKEKSTPEVFLV
jgi:hypothetical protein